MTPALPLPLMAEDVRCHGFVGISEQMVVIRSAAFQIGEQRDGMCTVGLSVMFKCVSCVYGRETGKGGYKPICLGKESG
jgi:hypothetical protein